MNIRYFLWFSSILSMNVSFAKFDACLFSEPGLYNVKEILENSDKTTKKHPAWKKKQYWRYCELAGLVAVCIGLPLLYVLNSNDSPEHTSRSILVLFGCILTYWQGKKMLTKGEQQDTCELEMQRVMDLRNKGYNQEANSIIAFWDKKQKSNKPEDQARYYAAKMGSEIPSTLSEQEREHLVTNGPAQLWTSS